MYLIYFLYDDNMSHGVASSSTQDKILFSALSICIHILFMCFIFYIPLNNIREIYKQSVETSQKDNIIHEHQNKQTKDHKDINIFWEKDLTNLFADQQFAASTHTSHIATRHKYTEIKKPIEKTSSKKETETPTVVAKPVTPLPTIPQVAHIDKKNDKIDILDFTNPTDNFIVPRNENNADDNDEIISGTRDKRLRGLYEYIKSHWTVPYSLRNDPRLTVSVRLYLSAQNFVMRYEILPNSSALEQNALYEEFSQSIHSVCDSLIKKKIQFPDMKDLKRTDIIVQFSSVVN